MAWVQYPRLFTRTSTEGNCSSKASTASAVDKSPAKLSTRASGTARRICANASVMALFERPFTITRAPSSANWVETRWWKRAIRSAVHTRITGQAMFFILVKLGNTNSSGPLPAFARCRQLGFSARHGFSAEAAVGKAGRDNQAHCSDLTLGGSSANLRPCRCLAIRATRPSAMLS